MSFSRHGEIYRSDGAAEGRGRNAASRWPAPGPSQRARRKARAPLIVRDEFPVGYSSAGCSPAEPASASPTAPSMRWADSAGNQIPANGNLSLVSVSQRRGSLQYPQFLFSCERRSPSRTMGRSGVSLVGVPRSPNGARARRRAASPTLSTTGGPVQPEKPADDENAQERQIAPKIRN